VSLKYIVLYAIKNLLKRFKTADKTALRRQSWVRIPPSAPFPFKISTLQILILIKKAPRVPLLKSRGHFLLVSRVDVMTSARLVAKIAVF
ncbi:MAG: hypothetical protein KBH26_05245, partial [Thiopseudomonas sp.]|nr:hypothetical protein [Thiopseudomonas sp.]